MTECSPSKTTFPHNKHSSLLNLCIHERLLFLRKNTSKSVLSLVLSFFLTNMYSFLTLGFLFKQRKRGLLR